MIELMLDCGRVSQATGIPFSDLWQLSRPARDHLVTKFNAEKLAAIQRERLQQALKA